MTLSSPALARLSRLCVRHFTRARDASAGHRIAAAGAHQRPSPAMAQTTLDEWAKDPVDPEIRAHVYSLITAVSCCALTFFAVTTADACSLVVLVMMGRMRSVTMPSSVSRTYANGSNSPTVN